MPKYMNFMQINELEYGWFGVEFGRKYISCSNYLDYDTPRALLRTVVYLLRQNKEEEWLYWPDEPGAYIMQVEKTKEELTFTFYSSTVPSYKLAHTDRPLEHFCGEMYFSLTDKIEKILDDLVNEFALYENGNGRRMYETHWMHFPEAEYKQLKKIAFAYNQKLGENNKMFFSTYLTDDDKNQHKGRF